jgi:hypothetical protein
MKRKGNGKKTWKNCLKFREGSRGSIIKINILTLFVA